jgi:hypothetical protein
MYIHTYIHTCIYTCLLCRFVGVDGAVLEDIQTISADPRRLLLPAYTLAAGNTYTATLLVTSESPNGETINVTVTSTVYVQSAGVVASVIGTDVKYVHAYVRCHA